MNKLQEEKKKLQETYKQKEKKINPSIFKNMPHIKERFTNKKPLPAKG